MRGFFILKKEDTKVARLLQTEWQKYRDSTGHAPDPKTAMSLYPKENPGKGCHSKRKHTPIVSKKQRGLFGAELARRRAGKKGRMPGITKEELRTHLRESKGKKLPKKAKR